MESFCIKLESSYVFGERSKRRMTYVVVAEVVVVVVVVDGVVVVLEVVVVVVVVDGVVVVLYKYQYCFVHVLKKRLTSWL